MLELTNKRATYNVANSDGEIKLTGEVTISNVDTITSFSGQFTVEDTYSGSYYYSENEQGKASKSLSDLDVAVQSKASQLLDTTIAEIKTTVE